MKIHLKKLLLTEVTLVFAFTCSALVCFLPTSRAVQPLPDGTYPNQSTAEGKNALYGLMINTDNPATRFDVLDSNTTGFDNALRSWMWNSTGRLNTGRYLHTATLLQNGMVLVAGGIDAASAELYDPASGTWTATGSLNTARDYHTATLLQNAMVLVAGGENNNSLASRKAELYNPASGTWAVTGSLNATRRYHTATLLQDGNVLVAAGVGDTDSSTSAELGGRHR